MTEKKRILLVILGIFLACFVCISATTQINLATQVKGLLAIVNGGTGASTASGALNALGGSGSGSCSTNQWVDALTAGAAPTCAQPAFSNLSGNISVSQMNSGSGASSSTYWRGDGTWASLSSSIPVADLEPGTSSQCIITSGGVTVWGSCAGTAGVQTLLSTSGSGGSYVSTSSTSTTSAQVLSGSYTFSGGQINSLGKTFRITLLGGGVNSSGSSEYMYFYLCTSSSSASCNFVVEPTSQVANDTTEYVSITLTCAVYTTGSSGGILCGGPANTSTSTGANGYAVAGRVSLSLDLTSAFTPTLGVAFATASTSNEAFLAEVNVEQLN